MTRSNSLFIRLFLSLAAILAVGMCRGVSPVVKNTLSNKHVNAIVQDSDGYVWIGTAKGLSKYNGYEYFQYFHADGDESSLPSDLIIALFIDSKGKMWVATDVGVSLYDAQTDSFEPVRYKGVPPSVEYGFIEATGEIYTYGLNGVKRISTGTMEVKPIDRTTALAVSTVITDRNGRLWMGCASAQGIFCADSGFKEFRQIYASPVTDVNCSFALSDDVMLFGTNNGIIAVDTRSMSVTDGWADTGMREQTARLNITFFHRTDHGLILVGTQNEGLLIYDPDTRTLVPSSESDMFTDVQSTHCTVCYTSDDNLIWLGTFDHGYYTSAGSVRRFNDDRILNDRLAGRFVTRIVEDGDGSLWIGTRYDGLFHYDPRTRNFTSYTRHDFAPFRREGGDFIQSLYVDSRGLLWIGYKKKLMYCRISDGKILSYRIFDIHSDIVTICEDPAGNVWTGSSSDGITVYDVAADESRLIKLPLLWNNVTTIIRLNSGDMLFSCYESGLYTACPETGEIQIVPLPDEVIPFSRRCVSMLETTDGELWIGTYTKGAVRLRDGMREFEIFQSTDGNANSDVLAMAEDENGCIWMSTSSGLSKFDPVDSRFYNFYEHDGTGGDQFHEKAVLKASCRTIYFGGNHGLTFFHPGGIVADAAPVRLILEDLKVLNKSVRVNASDKILQRHILHTDTIVLSHRNNVFSIDYSGLDFRSSQKIRYAYILHNFDKEWNYVGDYRRASYSNLKPGKYLFEVKGQNSDGIWSNGGPTLSIFVKPAPWFHPVAVTSYILLAASIVILLIQLHIRERIQREKIKMVEEQRNQEKQMNDLKIRFFTNISHELRTPLSLIFGPAKKLLNEDNDRENSRDLIKLLNYYADNLLRLVDQIMDFAKLESETLSLKVAQTSPAELVQEIINSYAYYAKEKNINVDLQADIPGRVVIDEDKFRKIISNLLSNALKYTPEGGSVEISLYTSDRVPEGFPAGSYEGTYLVGRVSDNGIGLNPEDIAHLFKRHRRFGARGRITDKIPGKGVGLHYVKSLTEIHKGSITVEAGTEKGLIFTFILPADEDVYTSEERADFVSVEVIPEVVLAGQDKTDPDEDGRPLSATTARNNKDTLLIAEDNPDLLKFISQIFIGEYNCELASNGVQAAGICREKSINLIISDIIMPEMDGLELCEMIKNDPELSHIPIILLTAKTMTSHQIEGYSRGADSYVSKPFDPTLLKTVVTNLLANRDRIRSFIVKGAPVTNSEEERQEYLPDTDKLNPLDRKFLDKLYGFLDRDLSDNAINVNVLGRELGFSRTSFYRKVKGLTGHTPTDFLRIYRLHKAAQLLKNPDYTIAEVVDITGFGTHSYFSLCFKKEFGISPKDFRKTHTQ